MSQRIVNPLGVVVVLLCLGCVARSVFLLARVIRGSIPRMDARPPSNASRPPAPPPTYWGGPLDGQTVPEHARTLWNVWLVSGRYHTDPTRNRFVWHESAWFHDRQAADDEWSDPWGV